MTAYTKRDLRAADMLAMILVGFGLVLVVFAVYRLAGSSGVETIAGKADAKAPKPANNGLGLWFLAAVFLAMGTALNLKIRQLIRTGGREPEDYAGVPE